MKEEQKIEFYFEEQLMDYMLQNEITCYTYTLYYYVYTVDDKLCQEKMRQRFIRLNKSIYVFMEQCTERYISKHFDWQVNSGHDIKTNRN